MFLPLFLTTNILLVKITRDIFVVCVREVIYFLRLLSLIEIATRVLVIAFHLTVYSWIIWPLASPLILVTREIVHAIKICPLQYLDHVEYIKYLLSYVLSNKCVNSSSSQTDESLLLSEKTVSLSNSRQSTRQRHPFLNSHLNLHKVVDILEHQRQWELC